MLTDGITLKLPVDVAKAGDIPQVYSATNIEGYIRAGQFSVAGDTLTLPDGTTFTRLDVTFGNDPGEVIPEVEGGNTDPFALTKIPDIDTSKITDITDVGSGEIITDAERGLLNTALQDQEQSDWNETDTSDPAFIQNKPTNLTQFGSASGEVEHFADAGSDVHVPDDKINATIQRVADLPASFSRVVLVDNNDIVMQEFDANSINSHLQFLGHEGIDVTLDSANDRVMIRIDEDYSEEYMATGIPVSTLSEEVGGLEPTSAAALNLLTVRQTSYRHTLPCYSADLRCSNI